jgi:hypothetical protein
LYPRAARFLSIIRLWYQLHSARAMSEPDTLAAMS